MQTEHLSPWLILINDFEVQKKTRNHLTQYIVLNNIAKLEKVL